MRIYLVGGAVRDELMDMPPKDYDYLVVGATHDSFMRSFPNAVKVVGKAPVYRVEVSGRMCELSFARREYKTGPGHAGFDYEAGPDISLIEDLTRRDFTVNAIARSIDSDVLIDPFDGQKDIKAKVLRHISPAFVEDPLRVYRGARLAAFYGFGMAPETVELCRQVSRAEIESLSPQVVGNELRDALMGGFPDQFFRALKLIGNPALDTWFPELVKLIGTPAGPPGHHDELDAFEHTMMVLEEANLLFIEHYTSTKKEPTDCSRELVNISALLHDLGKGITPREEWPRHHGHEEKGVFLVERFCDRLRLPADLKKAAVLACRNHLKIHRFCEMRKGKMVDLVNEAARNPLGVKGMTFVAMGDAIGRKSIMKAIDGPTAFKLAADAIAAEPGTPIPANLQGEAIGLHVRNKKGIAAFNALKAKGYV